MSVKLQHSTSKVTLLIILLTTIYILFYIISSFASQKKVVALSFDDGPTAEFTPAILKTLKDNDAKATFFVVGANAEKNPDLLKIEFDNGNDIGNHSYSHPNLSKLGSAAIQKEITRTNAAIYNAIKVYPVLFRPPFGASSTTLNQTLVKLGMRKVTWDYMVNDYDADKTTAEKIASQVLANVHPGSIINMHDGYAHREKTVAALPFIIAELKRRGYSFVTVSELLNIQPYQTKH